MAARRRPIITEYGTVRVTSEDVVIEGFTAKDATFVDLRELAIGWARDRLAAVQAELDISWSDDEFTGPSLKDKWSRHATSLDTCPESGCDREVGHIGDHQQDPATVQDVTAEIQEIWNDRRWDERPGWTLIHQGDPDCRHGRVSTFSYAVPNGEQSRSCDDCHRTLVRNR